MKQDEKSFLSKNRIIDAAMALFLEKGYEHTTMLDIVKASGMSKGAIYHHFRSKQEILSYLTDIEKLHFTEYLKNLTARTDLTAKEKLRQIITYFFTNDTLPSLTKEKWAEKVPSALLDTLRNSLNVISRSIEVILRQGTENKEFNCCCPRELSEVLTLLVDLWLDPAIADSTYLEMCAKVDFIALLSDKFDTPVFDEEMKVQIKEGLMRYYDDP